MIVQRPLESYPITFQTLIKNGAYNLAGANQK